MHVKKGDHVVITSGKDRGLKGEVIDIDRSRRRVKIHRRNMIVKHQKPNPLTGDEGARVEVEGWMDASNVSLYSDELDGPVRTRKKFVGEGGELYDDPQEAHGSFGGDAPRPLRKVRVATKTDEVFDEVQ